jgi:malonyl CoA-acyl carrier protein transacylase
MARKKRRMLMARDKRLKFERQERQRAAANLQLAQENSVAQEKLRELKKASEPVVEPVVEPVREEPKQVETLEVSKPEKKVIKPTVKKVIKPTVKKTSVKKAAPKKRATTRRKKPNSSK